jgi:hypothetical protein
MRQGKIHLDIKENFHELWRFIIIIMKPMEKRSIAQNSFLKH